MRIGIDGACWWNQRGFGRFTRELLKALFALPTEHRFCLFVDQPLELGESGDNVQVIRVPQSRAVNESAVAHGSRSPLDILAFTRATARARLDIMYFPAVYSWFPVFPGFPVVVTLHDAIAERFPRLVFPSWRGRLFWTAKLRLAKWQADRFMTVSCAAREEIVAHLGIPAELIDIISEAPDSQFRPVENGGARAAARARAGLPDRGQLLLYVGGLAPHKNLSGLLRGFAEAQKSGRLAEVTLAFVGDPAGGGFHSNYEELRSEVDREPCLRGRVFFTGFIPDEDLAALYSDAIAVVMPSFSEGFGLPAIEAMACGTPVLASNAGSLPEVVGNAGLYFDPYDSGQIAQSICRIIADTNMRSALRRRAVERAALFTWPRAAKQALHHLERCAGSR